MQYVTKHCIFCGEAERPKELYPGNFSEGDLTPKVFSARRVTEHLHYRIVRCENCGLVFSREVLPDEVLSALYSKSEVTFSEYAGAIGNDYLRYLKPFLGSIDKGAALEIGSSSGFFLERLLDAGFQKVFGCEPSVEAVKKAPPIIRDNTHQGFFKRGIYANSSFDLVCSFQTLDHVSDPGEVVKVCWEILKPGGLAYFVTHNVQALPARLMGEMSPIIDVEHIYLFGKATLRRLFEESGFEVLAVKSMTNRYPLNYWLKMLLKKGFGAFVRDCVRASGLGKLTVPIPAGNIFIVAKKPCSLKGVKS